MAEQFHPLVRLKVADSFRNYSDKLFISELKVEELVPTTQRAFLIGKNGVGKSRILNHIVTEFNRQKKTVIEIDLRKIEKTKTLLKDILIDLRQNSSTGSTYCYCIDNIDDVSSINLLQELLTLLTMDINSNIYMATDGTGFKRFPELTKIAMAYIEVERVTTGEIFRNELRAKFALKISDVIQIYPEHYEIRRSEDLVWYGEIREKLNLITDLITRERIDQVLFQLKKSGYLFTESDIQNLDSFRASINIIVRVNNHVNRFSKDKVDLVSFFNIAKASENFDSFVSGLKTGYGTKRTDKEFMSAVLDPKIGLFPHLKHFYSIIKYCQNQNKYPPYYKYWNKIAAFIFDVEYNNYDQFTAFYQRVTIGLEQPLLEFGSFMWALGLAISDYLSNRQLSDEELAYLKKYFMTLEKLTDFLTGKLNNVESLEDDEAEENNDNTQQFGRLSHRYHSPNNHSVEDQLNVTNDIKAFASLLAFRNATPPIAIGLFGNWGSGKSYFMNHIRKEIGEIKNPENSNEYCDRIVHVEFNAWHFRDANLWASLVNKIFTELSLFLKKGENKEDIESFYKKLASVKEDIKEVDVELKKVETAKSKIDSELLEIKRKKEETKIRLSIAHIRNLFSAVLKDSDVKGNLDVIHKDLDLKLGNSIEEIRDNLEKFNTAEQKMKSGFKIINQRGPLFILFGCFIISATFIVPYLYSLVQQEVGTLQKTLIAITTFLTSAVVTFTPVFTRVNKYYNKLKEIADNWDQLREANRNIKGPEEERLLAELEITSKKEKTLTLEKAEKDAIATKLETELRDIKSGKKLAEFIQNKDNNSRYKNKLGIISWVREDFDELNNLIRRQDIATKLNTNNGSDIKEELKIDRIILYIDDLDRCPEMRVVEVLEAVHLLLSFELFGVVVGVDPRWVSHSLKFKYKDLFSDGTKPEENKHFAASTYDYLEKIFQIPFALLPIEAKSAKKLLSFYLKEDQKNNEIVQKKEEGKKPVLKQEKKHSEPLVVSPEKNDDPKIIVVKPGEEEFVKQEKTLDQKPIPAKQLQITNEEIVFIEQLTEIIGSTPRTIQRFINVYRIIRAHPNVILPEQFSPRHQQIAGYLAIVIGKPNLAASIVKLVIEESNKDKSLSGLLAAKTDQKKELSEDIFKELVKVKCSELSEWMPLVSRFSFKAAEHYSKV
ncbi:MAG: family P-loop domain protein [Bacteroidetes bacterium]|jgi:hypothetical protein|nr:family P-loop domain protein [Bacteroidota bacterium]